MKFQLIQGKLPDRIKNEQVEYAIQKFIEAVEVKGNEIGFYNQTIETIYNAIKGAGFFWLIHDDTDVFGYMISNIARDIDGRLTYYITQSWIDFSLRRKKIVKEWMNDVREHAKQNFCKHLVIIAAREPKSFCRWLGNGTHIYATMLKEDF